MEISISAAVRASFGQPTALEARHVWIRKSGAWFFAAALFLPAALLFGSPAMVSGQAGHSSAPNPSISPSIQIQSFDVWQGGGTGGERF